MKKTAYYLHAILMSAPAWHALHEHPLPLSIFDLQQKENEICTLLASWRKEAALEAIWPKALSSLIYNYVQPTDFSIKGEVEALDKTIQTISRRFKKLNSLTITQIALPTLKLFPFRQIRYLHLSGCTQLTVLPELWVEILSLHKCRRLLKINPLLKCKHLRIVNCSRLQKISPIPHLLDSITILACSALKTLPAQIEARHLYLRGLRIEDLSTLTNQVKHLCCSSLVRLNHIGQISRFDKLTARFLFGGCGIQDGVYLKGKKSKSRHPLTEIEEAIDSLKWSDKEIIEKIKPHLPVAAGQEQGGFHMPMKDYISYIKEALRAQRLELMIYLLVKAPYGRQAFKEELSGSKFEQEILNPYVYTNMMEDPCDPLHQSNFKLIFALYKSLYLTESKHYDFKDEISRLRDRFKNATRH